MMLSIIVAVANHSAIGRRGDLAFHIREDLKRFKALTLGHTVVMGRKTFESLPKGALPGRRNIVVTRNPEAAFTGAETAASLEEAVEMARQSGETETFIIGGGQIYGQAMPLADRLEVTEIDADAPDADTFFPEIPADEWEKTEESATMTDPSGITYRFSTFTRC